ncbi:unnamed protein product [Somion occarium]|uniref:Zn(2)-C6 fungal-type domain-containing protein n=1 Tax=Somion occarium TaxID=3059160 RepID=A0ABP1E327_9APHY
MPADHSKSNPATRNRRPVRKDVEEDKLDTSHVREIELKRSRGEISCAECRRLKIRCDKTIPCQSCQRRGCAALCPNGSLATGQGTRFVLAATEHLHKRIAKMGERIRQLEDALAILQAKCSNEPHPLLRDDALVNTSAEKESDGPVSNQTPVKPADVIEAFGTLSVYDHGVSRFFGPTGGTEYLLYTESDSPVVSPNNSIGSKTPESFRDSMSPPVNPDLSRFSAAFPFTPMGPVNAVMELIESHLPSWERACHLCESYLQNAAWLFRGVSQQQLQLEMLPSIYHRPIPEEAAQVDYSGPHDFALLYLIFALGAVMDLKQDPYNSEGEHYHQLARAALVLQPILEKPSVVTIQALHLLSVYNGMSGNELGGGETSLETTWSLVAFAAQLSHSIGLHRDSARWGLPEALVNRRRLLFWNLFVADSWQSLTTGRPPAFSRDYIDCKFPASEDDPSKETDPEHDSLVGTWGFRFAFQCVAEVAARTLTAEAPSYATIMELDRKVREFPIPADASAFLEDIKTPADPDEEIPLSVSMTRFVLSHSREVILLSIHRAFFAQAILDCPENPLRSQYAPSFLASYRAATTILKAINDQFNILPTLCARFWVIWTYAFSSAVVFGTVVTRGPRSPLAQQAITKLDTACELFTKAAKLSRRAARALPLITKLQEKAHHAFNNTQSDRPGDGALWSIHPEDENADELEIFAGKTRLVETKRPSPVMMMQNASSDFPGLHLDTSGVYNSDYAAPVISPPSAPHIPPLPGLNAASDASWYSQAYNVPYPTQSAPSNQRTDYSVSPTYDQIPSSASSYGGQPWPPQSHTSSPLHQQNAHLQLPQLPQLPRQVSQTHSQQQPSPPSAQPSQRQPQYRLSPLHMQYGEPSTSAPQYRQAPSHLQPHQIPSQHQQQQAYISDRPQAGQEMYPAAPAFQGVTDAYVPPAELVNLGLASRDSRLDERWTSFMHDSGYLDTNNFQS